MVKERDVWAAFKDAFSGYGHWVRIEDSCGVGVPDVNGRLDSGPDWWLELKYTDQAPIRESTPVRLRHFTTQQKQWLVKRGSSGGHCGVLWRIDVEYFLLWWRDVPYLGDLNLVDLRKRALWYGASLQSKRLLSVLEGFSSQQI